MELNNSFYRLPTEEAFESWRKTTPPGFRFAVKGSRFLTHMVKLKDPERGLVNLVPRAELLKNKLGPILWQLPTGWKVNVEAPRAVSGGASAKSTDTPSSCATRRG